MPSGVGSPRMGQYSPEVSPGMASKEAAVDVPWVVHALALSTPVAISIAFYNGTLFSLHVAAMSFTYLFILPEGIILAVRALRHKSRAQMMRRHMYLQLSALTVAMTGLVAQFWHRRLLGKAHFQGLHSWLGAATLLGSQAAALIGLLLFYLIPKARRSTMPNLLAMHRLGGRVVFLLAVCTMLEALKIFDPQHKRNKGWVTYAIASAIVAQAVGMQGVLWPKTPMYFRSRSQGSERGSPAEGKPLVISVDRMSDLDHRDGKKEKD